MSSPINPAQAELGTGLLQTQKRESSGQEKASLLQVSSSSQSYYSRQESSVVTLSSSDATRPVNAPNASAELSPDDAANNILQLISQRLAQFLASGATKEDLQTKIEQAKQGFSQGVAQSREALESLGLLNAEQESRIDTIISRFNTGIETIANNLFNDPGSFTDEVAELTEDQIVGDKPAAGAATAAPTASNSVSTSTTSADTTAQKAALTRPDNLTKSNAFTSNYQSSRAAFLSEGSIDLQLRTQDGDIVTIRFFSAQGGSAGVSSGGLSNGRFELGFSNAFVQGFSNSNLEISVAGEIDEGELAALQELFAQLSDIANAFFNADDGQAFAQTLALNVDAEEIAQFSFNLQSREVQQISQQLSQYREVAQLKNELGNIRPEGFNDRPGKRYGFGHLLQQLREKSLEHTQVNYEEAFIEQLLSVSFAAASIDAQATDSQTDTEGNVSTNPAPIANITEDDLTATT